MAITHSDPQLDFPPPTPLSADALEQMEDDGHRYDLIRGELYQMSPAGAEHGEISAELAGRLSTFLRGRSLGRAYGAETGFRLADDTVLAPDAAFVRADRLPPRAERRGFLRLAPDLAVEIVSPSDRARYVNDKVLGYLDAGVQVVWVVEPIGQSVTVYAADRTARVLRVGETLDGGTVLPGFVLPLVDLFA